MADGVLSFSEDDASDPKLSPLFEYISNMLHDDLNDDMVAMQLRMSALQLNLRHFSIIPTNHGITAVFDGHHDDFEYKLKVVCDAFKLTNLEKSKFKVKLKQYFIINLKAQEPDTTAEELWHRCTELHNLLDHLMTQSM